MIKLFSILAILVSTLFIDNDPQKDLILVPKKIIEHAYFQIKNPTEIKTFDQLLIQKEGQEIKYFEFLYIIKGGDVVVSKHNSINENLNESDLKYIKNAQKGDMILIDNIQTIKNDKLENNPAIIYYVQ
jgi:hypothetical protein